MSGKWDEIRIQDSRFSEDNEKFFYFESSFFVFDLVLTEAATRGVL